jgi:outer membrane lipoprotein SlyB
MADTSASDRRDATKEKTRKDWANSLVAFGTIIGAGLGVVFGLILGGGAGVAIGIAVGAAAGVIIGAIARNLSY